MSQSSLKKRKFVTHIARGQALEIDVRDAHIAAATSFLKATRGEFAARVANAKKRLMTTEPIVLAGPVKRIR